MTNYILRILLIIVFYSIAPVLKLQAIEQFTWPTNGYLGWLYNTDTQTSEGIHNGIDIWSNADGGWNNDVPGSSNPVYAAYPGQIVYTEDINWHGFIIKHNDNLYTNYWHVKDWNVGLWNNVDENSLMGYQDYAAAVHLHFTVSATSSGSGNIDPSPYLDMQLNVENSDPVAWGTYVSHSSCGGNTISLQGNYNDYTCNAADSITVQPESNLTGESILFIQ